LCLSADPTKPAVAFYQAQLIGASAECINVKRSSSSDHEQSNLRIGGQFYRVLIETEPEPKREVEVANVIEVEAKDKAATEIELKAEVNAEGEQKRRLLSGKQDEKTPRPRVSPGLSDATGRRPRRDQSSEAFRD
jgi:hypothetical protein